MVAIESIIEGLEKNDPWVERAMVVLETYPDDVVLFDRRKIRNLAAELKVNGKLNLESLLEARGLAIRYASVLYKIANATQFDFNNKTFVVTGTLTNYSRASIHAKLKSLGALVAMSVSRMTDVLIAGEKPGGAKLLAANVYSTPLWTEKELESNMALRKHP